MGENDTFIPYIQYKGKSPDHYKNVIITSLALFTQPFIQAQIKENMKAPRHWPLCGELTGDRWIPRTKGQ